MTTTLYQRLLLYSENNKTRKLSMQEKSDLGRLVAKSWYASGGKPEFTFSVEDHGSFKVKKYPASFSPEIDKIISDFYRQKFRRKRIPHVRKPILSFSPKYSK